MKKRKILNLKINNRWFFIITKEDIEYQSVQLSKEQKI